MLEKTVIAVVFTCVVITKSICPFERNRPWESPWAELLSRCDHREKKPGRLLSETGSFCHSQGQKLNWKGVKSQRPFCFYCERYWIKDVQTMQ